MGQRDRVSVLPAPARRRLDGAPADTEAQGLLFSVITSQKAASRVSSARLQLRSGLLPRQQLRASSGLGEQLRPLLHPASATWPTPAPYCRIREIVGRYPQMPLAAHQTARVKHE